MPSARKRGFQEDGDSVLPQPATEPPSILHRLRNMWQFANLFQFILLFGKPLKLKDDFDIEDLEAECLKPGSTLLQDIGLGLLKFLSSHRGLTHDLFDEYSRRQFLAKAPNKNPFGTDEIPARFSDFDVFKKIRVLQDMTQLVMMSPERLREKCEEQKDTEQTNWRIEPYGWDADDREYYVLDDNRIYRITEAPPPPPKPKKNSKKAKAAQRASKRRRVSAAAAASEEDEAAEEEQAPAAEPEDDGFGGRKWECLAVTLDEVRQFLSTIRKSKDDNERVLRKQIEEHLVPILEKQEESRKRKQLQREKELLALEKMAHAKRSSRIASKMEHQKAEEQARLEEKKRRDEEAARRKEESRLAKIERERERRLVSREQRLKEREVRRLQHEEELAQLSGDGTSAEAGRMSERQRQAEIEKNKEALRELEEEEEDWIFDCICGVYGQVDDGTHSVACEKCNVWQHSKCLGIDEKDAEADDFHFVCSTCRRREQAEKEQPPRMIKIKVKGHDSPTSSPPQKQAEQGRFPPSTSTGSKLVIELQQQQKPVNQVPLNGSAQGSRGDENMPPTQGKESKAVGQPDSKGSGEAVGIMSPLGAPNNSQNNPFSSPHPNLSPPGQSPNKSKAYDTIFDRSSPTPAAADSADIRRSPLEHSMNGALPVLSPPTGNGSGSGVSPLKHSQPPSSPPAPTTKNMQSPFPLSKESGGALPTRGLTNTPSTPAMLPPFSAQQVEPGASDGDRSTPLPPSRGGLSPTKHSPTLPQHGFPQVNGTPRSAGANAAGSGLFPPPSAALSPTPQPQILTPPVKHAEPVRTPSQQPPFTEAA
ncbi:hypothetical protein V8F20_006525 [Naviculisporaceae sp. PSN 640]